MAYEIPVLVDSKHLAYADLSTHQFKFVKLTSNGIELCAAATDKPFGVLQNAPIANEAAEVLRIGVSKVKAGGTIAIGAAVGPNASGLAVAKVLGTDTTNFVAGHADEAAVSGDIISVGINCVNAGRAA